MSAATSSLEIIQPPGPHHAAASPIDTRPSSIAAIVISGVTGAKLWRVQRLSEANMGWISWLSPKCCIQASMIIARSSGRLAPEEHNDLHGIRRGPCWLRERQSEPRGSSVNPTVSQRAIRCLKLRVAVRGPVQILPLTPKASHPTSHLVVDKFLNVSGPFVQGFAFFIRVLIPLVNANNSTFT